MSAVVTSVPKNLQGDHGTLPETLRSSWAGLLLVTILCLIYAPVVAAAATNWFTDDAYSHGVFIIPVCLWLIWMQRDELQALPVQPTAWGLLPLAFGLLLEVAAILSGSKSLAMLTLIPVLAGAVLILHGKELWKASAFPICFLFFTARMPFGLTESTSLWVQSISSSGAAHLMKYLGYPIIQKGNLIELPGIVLEVADVCSGFKKLIAFLAFSILYGYLFRLSPGRRILLILISVPIAVAANIVRISGLIAVTSAGGIKALHLAHDPAELVVLVIAFSLFVTVGKWLGCDKIRFSR